MDGGSGWMADGQNMNHWVFLSKDTDLWQHCLGFMIILLDWGTWTLVFCMMVICVVHHSSKTFPHEWTFLAVYLHHHLSVQHIHNCVLFLSVCVCEWAKLWCFQWIGGSITCFASPQTGLNIHNLTLHAANGVCETQSCLSNGGLVEFISGDQPPLSHQQTS